MGNHSAIVHSLRVEVDYIWQIAALARKRYTFLVRVSRTLQTLLRTEGNSLKVARGLDVKWHTPSACLDGSRSGFQTLAYSDHSGQTRAICHGTTIVGFRLRRNISGKIVSNRRKT